MGFPSGLVVKNPLTNAGDVSSILESGRSPGRGNGNSLRYACLGIPMERGAWQATYSSWGGKESDRIEQLSTHAQRKEA